MFFFPLVVLKGAPKNPKKTRTKKTIQPKNNRPTSLFCFVFGWPGAMRVGCGHVDIRVPVAEGGAGADLRVLRGARNRSIACVVIREFFTELFDFFFESKPPKKL
jgi:hypothetical protein